MRVLRGIAALTLVVVLFTAASARADDAEERAVSAIEKLGGKVVRDETAKGKPVVRVHLGYSKTTDTDLKGLKALKSLHTLDLLHTGITDEGLKEIKDLKSVQNLNL